MAEAEIRWIAHYRESGARLTNQGSGGEGCARWQKVSPEEFFSQLRYSGIQDDDWSEFDTEEEDFDPNLRIETVGNIVTISRIKA